MGVASMIISMIALLVALVGLVPFLGWLNWAALVLAALGLVFGIIPVAQKKKSGVAIAGFVFSILVIVIAVIRLFLGGGIL
jgi:hypothetical protein